MATLLPDAFFAEEANRFGNLIFVREEGVAEATRQAVTAIATCLEKPGGCVVVPGVTGTLWGFSAAAAAVAGVIAGAATSYGRASGEGAAKGLLYASPLWIFALGGVSLFPVLARGGTMQGAADVALFVAVLALFARARDPGGAVAGDARNTDDEEW